MRAVRSITTSFALDSAQGIDGSIDGGIDASVGGNDGVDRVDSPAVYDTGAMDVENDYPTITCPSTTAGVEILCGGLCINPATDMTYCGASFGCGESGMGSAGTPCPGDSICNAGRCSTRCGVNSTACVALDGRIIVLDVHGTRVVDRGGVHAVNAIVAAHASVDAAIDAAVDAFRIEREARCDRTYSSHSSCLGR